LKIIQNQEDLKNIRKIEKNQEKCGNLRKFEKIKNFVTPSLTSPSPSTFTIAAVYRVFFHEGRVLRRK
jgi:hypothetical protein